MSAPTQPLDTPSQQFSKILPADVTGAFLGIHAAIQSTAEESIMATAVFICLAMILAACPLYFRYVMNVKSPIQNAFLCLSFIVYAATITRNELETVTNSNYRPYISIATAVIPIFWTTLIAPIFVIVLGARITEQNSPATDGNG